MSAPPSPRPRSRGRRAVDALLAQTLKLSPASSDYTWTADLRIPTRDGAVLLADHLAPVGPAGGTILVRGPYSLDAIGTTAHGGIFAGYGYHVVLARARGTFGAGGSFDPFVHEIDDAADTVAWLRRHPFFTGRFASFGASCLGFAQWTLLVEPPPEPATALIQVAAHDGVRRASFPAHAARSGAGTPWFPDSILVLDRTRERQPGGGRQQHRDGRPGPGPTAGAAQLGACER